MRQRVPSSHDLIDGMSHAARHISKSRLGQEFSPHSASCPLTHLFFSTWCSEAQQPVATILSNIETQQRSTSRGPTIVRLEIRKCSSRSVCSVQTCQYPFDIIQTPQVQSVVVAGIFRAVIGTQRIDKSNLYDAYVHPLNS